jgi:hypothetical protein
MARHQAAFTGKQASYLSARTDGAYLEKETFPRPPVKAITDVALRPRLG